MPGTLFHAYGLCLRVEAYHDAVADAVHRVLPPGTVRLGPPAGPHRPTAPPMAGSQLCGLSRPVADRRYAIRRVPSGLSAAARYQLGIDGEPATEAPSLDDLLIYLRLDARAFVTERAHGFVFVHAGVVAWQGTLIALPGHSHAGKTTLVAALLRAGATYYSDDYAPIDVRGRVHPYPVPLAARTRDGRRRPLAPADLGGRCGTAPARLGLVLFTSYRPGAMWAPRPLPLSEAVHRLLVHTPCARRRFAEAATHLQGALAGALCLASPRGDVSVAVEQVQGAVARRPTPAAVWQAGPRRWQPPTPDGGDNSLGDPLPPIH